MKKNRFLSAVLILTLIITLFSSCGGKNRQTLGEGSEYPCGLEKKGSGYVLSLKGKSGYSWKYELEDGGAFEVRTLKTDEKKTELEITPGKPGTIDTLILTLEKDGMPVSMPAYRTEITFHNEHTGEFSVFDSSFKALTGDILYGEGTATPYTIQEKPDGTALITLIKQSEDDEYSSELSDSDVISVSLGEADEKTQKITVYPITSGVSKLYISPVDAETALCFNITVSEDSSLTVPEAEVLSYSVKQAQAEAVKEQLDGIFGEISFPKNTSIKVCKKYSVPDKDGKLCTWAQYIIELPGKITAGYFIASNNSADDIKNKYAVSAVSEKKLGDISAYSFETGTQTKTVAWNSSDGHAAFMINAETEENAVKAAEILSVLNATVKEVPSEEPIAQPSETESETDSELRR